MRITGRWVVQWALVLIAAAGLAIDAYVHFDLASAYAAVKSSTLSEGDLFRIEGTAAAIAAAAVLLRPRRYTAAFACAVAAAGTAAVLVYRYVNVGAFGPFPNMYEPIWYAKKTLSAYAEGIAAIAALALLGVLHFAPSRRAATDGRPDDRPSEMSFGERVSSENRWRARRHPG